MISSAWTYESVAYSNQKWPNSRLNERETLVIVPLFWPWMWKRFEDKRGCNCAHSRCCTVINSNLSLQQLHKIAINSAISSMQACCKNTSLYLFFYCPVVRLCLARRRVGKTLMTQGSFSVTIVIHIIRKLFVNQDWFFMGNYNSFNMMTIRIFAKYFFRVVQNHRCSIHNYFIEQEMYESKIREIVTYRFTDIADHSMEGYWSAKSITHFYGVYLTRCTIKTMYRNDHWSPVRWPNFHIRVYSIQVKCSINDFILVI